jgi:hypothetical protein
LCVALWFSGCANFITPIDMEALPKDKAAAGDLSKVRKKVLVLDFLNRSRHGGEELGKIPTEEMKAALGKIDDFTIVKQEEIEGYETFVDDIGEYNLHSIFERARSHNIAGVVTGVIRDINVHHEGEEAGLFRMREYTVEASLKISLYDPYTEHEIYTKVVSGESTDERTDFFNEKSIDDYDKQRAKLAVTRAMEKLYADLPSFADKIGWAGRIAKVDLHRYYINAGELTGLERGQLLKVYDEGQPIYDPDTKTLLGIAPGYFKGLLKIVDYFGQDGAVAVLYSGGGFKERDRVEIFSNVQNQ